MKKIVIAIAVVMACLLLAASPVLAGGLTVSGAKIESTVTAGNDYAYSMTVENTSDGPMDILIEAKGYGMTPDRDFVVLEPDQDQSPYSARTMLTISPREFHLDPGAQQPVKITARVPANIGSGARYAIVLVHTAPKGGAVSVVTAVAARVLLTVAETNLDATVEISGVSLSSSSPQAPASATMTIANKGNYHLKPQISAKLRNGNEVVATASLAPGWPILPGFSRQFKVSFPGQVSSASSAVDIELKDEAGKLVATTTYPTQSPRPPLQAPIVRQSVPAPEAVPAPSPAAISVAPQPSVAASRPQPAPAGQPTPSAPATAPQLSWPVFAGAATLMAVAGVVFLSVKRRTHV